MKLAYKIGLGAGFLCVAFFICFYMGGRFLADTSLSLFGLALVYSCYVFFSLVIGFYYVLVVRRVIGIEAFLNDVCKKHQYTERLDDHRSDEISRIILNINSILEVAYASNIQIEARVNARTVKLQNKVDDLKQILSKHEIVKNNLLIHNQHLLRMARYDNLTELPNQLSFNETLNQRILESRKHRKIFALLVVRLDNFKSVNDTLGRKAGDLVLMELANRYKMLLRSGDTLARTNGAEFSILLEDIVHDEVASLIAEKILAASISPFKFDYKNIKMTSSVGIVLYPLHGTSLEELLKNADTAAYKAEHGAANKFQFFNQEMSNESNKLIMLDFALRKAIQNNEFVLYFQPKLDLIDGHIVGVEALLRWQSPVLGLVQPNRFLPLAEKTGSIFQLGEWVLREICRIHRSWKEQGLERIPIAINLSLSQFRHQDFVTKIDAILKKENMDAGCFEVEISSSTLMSDVATSISTLRAMSNAGVKIVIDEFGLGMISLDFLKDLPISYLKIDQRFVRGIPANDSDTDIAKAIIELANILKIKVIATGIETLDQCQFFINNNCKIGQGYLFGKPLSEEDLALNYFGIC